MQTFKEQGEALYYLVKMRHTSAQVLGRVEFYKWFVEVDGAVAEGAKRVDSVDEFMVAVTLSNSPTTDLLYTELRTEITASQAVLASDSYCIEHTGMVGDNLAYKRTDVVMGAHDCAQAIAIYKKRLVGLANHPGVSCKMLPSV